MSKVVGVFNNERKQCSHEQYLKETRIEYIFTQLYSSTPFLQNIRILSKSSTFLTFKGSTHVADSKKENIKDDNHSFDFALPHSILYRIRITALEEIVRTIVAQATYRIQKGSVFGFCLMSLDMPFTLDFVSFSFVCLKTSVTNRTGSVVTATDFNDDIIVVKENEIIPILSTSSPNPGA